jgi:fatty-acyl-CoA synthase
MLGRMMDDYPLTLTHFLDRARTFFPSIEVVARLPDGTVHRTNYGSLFKRVCRLANALRSLGIGPGDRVATLCWNHPQHLEAYFAIPAMGAVLHTLNLRLHPSELGYIANHADDVAVIVDESLLPLFEKFRSQIRSLKHVVVVSASKTTITTEGNLDYEALLARESDAYDFPRLDERSAAILCYTSGTTGNPKGVLYSHRSTALHTIVMQARDAMGIGADDVVLPAVPMFHAAGWGLPFTCAGAGAKIVFPGNHLDPEALLDILEAERITLAAGVPTIWFGVLEALDRQPKRWDLSRLRTILFGGSAAPPAIVQAFKQRHDLDVQQAWGMTETNPIATISQRKPHLPPESDLAMRATQGIPVMLVETRHVGDDGTVLPHDGAAMGELQVRGPWVAASYFGDEGKDRFTADGWLKTGDVATIDDEGYVRIADRSKDVIKSGGEWISSVALENALMSHPAILEAAVFAARHPKWDERPVAAIVLRHEHHASDDELRAHLEGKFAKFWMPDAFVRLDQVPRTSTGKFLKTKLRQLYGDLLLPRT